MEGRVLIVAGSDSGGGAGIQADIKTVTALGAYAATAITALTAQNTMGVFGIVDVAADFVVLQMRLVLSDIGADCIKIGMLHRVDIVEAVAAVLAGPAAGIPVVLDPVMVAKGGAPLISEGAVAAIRHRLLPLATVLTPNLPEAEALAGGPATPAALASTLLAMGPRAVLIKGGHNAGDMITDLLLEQGAPPRAYAGPRLASTSTHGTGCTLASAIAASLAQGVTVADAVARARAYVVEAIRRAPGFGQGHGPLDHGHPLSRPNDRDGS